MAPRIFWKTGTSYGHRDAWAVGANDRYAVGVWLGNFDNTPSRSLVGATRAGPILFDVLDALTDRAMIAEPESVPDDLVEVAVCALSGRVLTSACAQRSTALALKTEVPTASCPFHHRFEIDRETGHALCPMCRHGRTTTVKNVAVLPNSLRSFVTDAAWGDDEVPSHLPICPEVLARTPPIIIEPQRGTELFLVPGMSPARQEIPLVVRTDSREQEVFWFVDGRLHARTSANAPAWLAPREGRMEIKVLDSTGRSASVTIKVHALL